MCCAGTRAETKHFPSLPKCRTRRVESIRIVPCVQGGVCKHVFYSSKQNFSKSNKNLNLGTHPRPKFGTTEDDNAMQASRTLAYKRCVECMRIAICLFGGVCQHAFKQAQLVKKHQKQNLGTSPSPHLWRDRLRQMVSCTPAS